MVRALSGRVLGILREINRQGTTVVLVEQNAREALRIAHRAYEAYLGEAG